MSSSSNDSIAAAVPTGLLDYNSTINFTGPTNIVASPGTIASDNLTKSNNNEVICSSIDHFNNNNNNKSNKEIILIIIFLAILITLHFI